jgi:hypothetical protein
LCNIGFTGIGGNVIQLFSLVTIYLGENIHILINNKLIKVTGFPNVCHHIELQDITVSDVNGVYIFWDVTTGSVVEVH